MLESPFTFEANFTTEEYHKLGRMMLRWSHIEHVTGNCLRAILRLSPAEANAVIFPMSLEQRLNKIGELADPSKLSADAFKALSELTCAAKAINFVRNTVVHTVISEDGQIFELRSKGRKLTKIQIFESEELTNYAAHAVIVFRWALGDKGVPLGGIPPLPDRPAIPEFLRSFFPKPQNQR